MASPQAILSAIYFRKLSFGNFGSKKRVDLRLGRSCGRIKADE